MATPVFLVMTFAVISILWVAKIHDQRKARKYIFDNRRRVLRGLDRLVPFVEADGVRSSTREKFRRLGSQLDQIVFLLWDETVDWVDMRRNLETIEFQVNNSEPILAREVTEARKAKERLPELMAKVGKRPKPDWNPSLTECLELQDRVYPPRSTVTRIGGSGSDYMPSFAGGADAGCSSDGGACHG